MKCYGCFKPLRTEGYCSKCKHELFNGRNINQLNFDIQEFYEYRQSQAPRISISGVQDKISLKLEGNELLPTATDGTYILKPVPATKLEHSEDIVANEHLSMQISKQIFNIPTAANAIVRFRNGEKAYLVKRFDYAKDGNKLDQEDFASIIGMSEETDGANYKYDANYELIAKAIKKYVAASPIVIEDFYLRIILNYLIGNGDAHLKNFSLYRPEGRTDYELTPNYDLLFTGYHVHEMFGVMGLELFETYETKAYGALGYYSLEDFESFANILEIPSKRLIKMYKHIFSSMNNVEHMIENSFMTDNGKEEYLKNFRKRLLKGLAYSIEKPGYEFESILKPLVEEFLNSLS